MIDLAQFDPKTVLTTGIWIGTFAGGFVGFLTAAILSGRRIREAHSDDADDAPTS